MKIAFCIENFITTRGGAEQYVHDLSILLTERGHEVHIYTMKSRRRSGGKLHIHMVNISMWTDSGKAFQTALPPNWSLTIPGDFSRMFHWLQSLR